MSQAVAPDSSYVVKEIILEGNKRTKDYIILRELGFSLGDTIVTVDLGDFIKRKRNLIFNTRLFNKTEIHYRLEGQDVFLRIEMIERWYIWPVPIINFADRNVNVWLETKDPSRLNYGLYFQDYNFRGRMEILKINLLAGYTQLVGVDYQVPYVNGKKTLGLHLETSYSSNKEVWYETRNNRVQFYFHPESPAIQRADIKSSLIWRPGFYSKHTFGIGHQMIRVADTVVSEGLNPEYMLQARKLQNNTGFYYTFIWDRRDIAYYPLEGHFFQADFAGDYFMEAQVLVPSLTLNLEKFWKLGKFQYFAIGWRSRLMSGDQIPYPLTRGLGYRFNVRGFEPYVVDGANYTCFKTNYKLKIVSKTYRIKVIKMTQFNYIPVGLYLNIYADAGYAHNPTGDERSNDFQNHWLSGYGMGLDFVTFYDRVLRVEYSFNNFGIGGIYINFTTPI